MSRGISFRMPVIRGKRHCLVQRCNHVPLHIRIGVFIDCYRRGGVRRVDKANLVLSNVTPFKLKGEITAQNRSNTKKPHKETANKAIS